MGWTRVHLASAVLVLLGMTSAAWGDSPEQMFHRAYYLEHEENSIEAAAALYGQVAGSSSASAELRAEARVRQESCQEEIASADFARLMMPNTLLYAELNHPGGQLVKLAEQLHLLRRNGEAPNPGQRIALSEAIFRELLGIRGAALGITGIDPSQSGKPIGVVVVHPGNVDLLRGAIESALPVGGKKLDDIEGFATYDIEGEVFVTLTRRLAIASPQRAAIANVVRRLKGMETSSILDKPAFQASLAQRGDSLFYFCLDFKPVLPLIQAGMAMASRRNPEAAVLGSVLDIQSLQTVSGQLGVTADGPRFDLAVRLDEGHRNLVFNLLRFPPVDASTMKQIPEGAAFFAATALNPRDARRVGSPDAQPAVSILDLGREIFANIIGISVFGVAAPGETLGGEPAPGIAAVISVHDTAKSQALWTQFLGVAGVAAGGGSMDGEIVDMGGVEARRFRLPEGVSLYFATAGSNVIISPSPTAMKQSLATLNGGRSLLDDAVYRSTLEGFGDHTTLAAAVHPGRCLELAQPFMNRHEREEVQPFVPMLEHTVASIGVHHSDDALRLGIRISGLPPVGPVISDLVMQDRLRAEQRVVLARASQAENWDQALSTVDAMQKKAPADADLTWKRFEILAIQKSDHQAARTCASQLEKLIWNDARPLNDYAWYLVSQDRFGGHFNALGLRWAKRANELTKHAQWAYVDTLARAHFENGDVVAAVKLQKKALELVGPDARRGEVQAALDRFSAALASGNASKVETKF